jgi:metallo-beta-lactamase family protein
VRLPGRRHPRRALARGARSLRIYGEDVPVARKVVQLGRLRRTPTPTTCSTGCAARTAPRGVFVVHGEPDAADALRAAIARELGWRPQSRIRRTRSISRTAPALTGSIARRKPYR